MTPEELRMLALHLNSIQSKATNSKAVKGLTGYIRDPKTGRVMKAGDFLKRENVEWGNALTQVGKELFGMIPSFFNEMNGFVMGTKRRRGQLDELADFLKSKK